MPPGFERANIRFFYLFKNNIAGFIFCKRIRRYQSELGVSAIISYCHTG